MDDMLDKPNILFVGAHHDDLELGAGGLIKSTISAGYSVGFVVLTDSEDAQEASLRREESLMGLCHLGANVDSIAFASMRDGNMICDRKSVDILRISSRNSLDNQSIVISHTRNDAHLDHICTNMLVEASFRNVAFLGFAVSNSLILSRFEPSLCVDIEDIERDKISAILKHESQCAIGRINEENVKNIHRFFAKKFNKNVCEVYDETYLFGNCYYNNPIDVLIDDGILHRFAD